MDDRTFSRLLMRTQKKNSSSLTLDHGSRVAVIGGDRQALSSATFLLDMAERTGLKINVDITSQESFDMRGPLVATCVVALSTNLSSRAWLSKGSTCLKR